jgi:hypothetical protein
MVKYCAINCGICLFKGLYHYETIKDKDECNEYSRIYTTFLYAFSQRP